MRSSSRHPFREVPACAGPCSLSAESWSWPRCWPPPAPAAAGALRGQRAVRHLLFGGIDAPDAAILDGRLHGPRGSRLVRFAEDAEERALPALHGRGRPPRDAAARGAGAAPRARPRRRRPLRRRHVVLEGLEPAPRHGLPRRLALRRRDRRDRPRALRPVDGTSRGRVRAGRHGPPRRRQPLDAHRALRSGRLDVRVGRLELQRVRREGPAARGDGALPARRQRGGDLRDGPAQLGRLRLAARRRRSSTRPTTAATCSATTSRPAS